MNAKLRELVPAVVLLLVLGVVISMVLYSAAMATHHAGAEARRAARKVADCERICVRSWGRGTEGAVVLNGCFCVIPGAPAFRVQDGPKWCDR